MDVIEAEKEFNWLEAVKINRIELKSQTDIPSVARTWEKTGFCYNYASRQADNSDEFMKLMQLAVEAYETAAKLFSEQLIPENKGRNATCLALSEYSRSWLEFDFSEKRKTLLKCCELGRKASTAFKNVGDMLNFSKNCLILSQCLYDLVAFTSEGEEKIKVAREGLESATEAISELTKLKEEDHLVNAFSYASLHSYHLANLSELEGERKEFEKQSLGYAENAVALSRETANPYSNIMSMWAKALAIFFFEENLEIALEYAREMLKKATATKDNYFGGMACYLVTYIEYWMAFKEEDTEKRSLMYNEIIKYSEAAIRHFQLVCRDSDTAEAHLFYAESYSILANEIATTKAEKIAFSAKAAQIGENGLKLAVRSGSADAMTSLLHALSKAYHYSAKLESQTEKKINLLKNALSYRKDNVKLVEQSFATNFWMLGVNMAYAAQIEEELASLEKDENTKLAVLKDAINDIEKGVSNANKWLKSCPALSLMTVAANYDDAFGGMLTQRYIQTKEKENLIKANKSYSDSATKFREVGLPSRVAESYWKIAKNLDTSSDYKRAAENFENAFAGYKSAATKIPQFGDFFLDYASYMKAWSEIDKAKFAHNNEEYKIAMDHYEKSSQLLRQSKSWMYLSLYFYAWALLEQAESLSRKEDFKESAEAFEKATKFLQESKRILILKLETIDKGDEADLVKKLIGVSDTRSEFIQGRIAIEEAKVFEKQGEHITSSEKYSKAATIFQKISLMDSELVGKEAKQLTYLCQAWQRMTIAETTASPIMYEEAAELFKLANEHALKESAGLMALGHSSFCKALEAGTEFEITRTMAMYHEATRHMETAAGYYLKAGFETTSDYAKATQRLFDAYVFMESAKRERDPDKQAGQYSMAEKVLQNAVEYFEKAKYPDKTAQAKKVLQKVRDEKRLSLSLGEIFHAPDITSSTGSFSTIATKDETAVGLERFEHADIQAKIVQHETEIKVGNTVTFEIQLVNVGKESLFLTTIENLVPVGFQLVGKPDYCQFEDSRLTMKGRRLEPLKTDEIKFELRAFKKGMIEIKPSIICLDRVGNPLVFNPEPIILNVTGAILPGRIPTGYADLDNLLFGGIPENCAVILESPSNDEREILIKKFLETGVKNGQTTYFISSEVGNVANLVEEFPTSFSLFLCNPRAEVMIKSLPNVFKLKGAENLTDIDIALIKSFRTLAPQKEARRVCITIVSDILLQHHAVITRKWLSGLLADLKSKGFTTLAVINQEMHPPEEVQALIGLFEGEIRVSERDTDRGLEKILRVRKLCNQRYLDSEIVLTREKLEC